MEKPYSLHTYKYQVCTAKSHRYAIIQRVQYLCQIRSEDQVDRITQSVGKNAATLGFQLVSEINDASRVNKYHVQL